MTDSEKLDLLLNKVTSMEGKMTSMEGKMTSMEGDIASMKGDIASTKGEMTSMKGEITAVKNEMTSMKSKISSLEYRVTDIQLTLDNETNKGIQIIAEGHLDLARRLHDALRVESDKEIASLRLSMLENEVRRLRDKIEQPA